MSKEYKIKFHKKGLSLKDGTDKYEVRTKGEGQTVKFDDKVKDGGTAEGPVELEFKKESESTWTPWTVEKENVKYAETTFFKGVKITKKQLKSDAELKEELPQAGVGFFASKRWPFWAVVAVVVLSLIGLIWWWIASRRKEDKEEESL